ncbi:MAG: hypothetical protein LBC13_02710, partial [Clostridiales bacterium]|nr:hypothetical protein [Clostridiales bacterium]
MNGVLDKIFINHSQFGIALLPKALDVVVSDILDMLLGVRLENTTDSFFMYDYETGKLIGRTSGLYLNFEDERVDNRNLTLDFDLWLTNGLGVGFSFITYNLSFGGVSGIVDNNVLTGIPDLASLLTQTIELSVTLSMTANATGSFEPAEPGYTGALYSFDSSVGRYVLDNHGSYKMNAAGINEYDFTDTVNSLIMQLLPDAELILGGLKLDVGLLEKALYGRISVSLDLAEFFGIGNNLTAGYSMVPEGVAAESGVSYYQISSSVSAGGDVSYAMVPADFSYEYYYVAVEYDAGATYYGIDEASGKVTAYSNLRESAFNSYIFYSKSGGSIMTRPAGEAVNPDDMYFRKAGGVFIGVKGVDIGQGESSLYSYRSGEGAPLFKDGVSYFTKGGTTALIAVKEKESYDFNTQYYYYNEVLGEYIEVPKGRLLAQNTAEYDPSAQYYTRNTESVDGLYRPLEKTQSYAAVDVGAGFDNSAEYYGALADGSWGVIYGRERTDEYGNVIKDADGNAVYEFDPALQYFIRSGSAAMVKVLAGEAFDASVKYYERNASGAYISGTVTASNSAALIESGKLYRDGFRAEDAGNYFVYGDFTDAKSAVPMFRPFILSDLTGGNWDSLEIALQLLEKTPDDEYKLLGGIYIVRGALYLDGTNIFEGDPAPVVVENFVDLVLALASGDDAASTSADDSASGGGTYIRDSFLTLVMSDPLYRLSITREILGLVFSHILGSDITEILGSMSIGLEIGKEMPLQSIRELALGLTINAGAIDLYAGLSDISLLFNHPKSFLPPEVPRDATNFMNAAISISFNVDLHVQMTTGTVDFGGLFADLIGDLWGIEAVIPEATGAEINISIRFIASVDFNNLANSQLGIEVHAVFGDSSTKWIGLYFVKDVLYIDLSEIGIAPIAIGKRTYGQLIPQLEGKGVGEYLEG